MTKHVFLLLAVFGLIAAACGDDEGGSTAAPSDPRAQQIVDLISEDEEFPMTEAEANCTANNMVNTLDDSTIDTLINNPDAEFDELENPEEAVKAIDAMLDCVDLETMMVDEMIADGTDEESARCLAEGFGEDELRGFVRAAALPEDQVDEEVMGEIIGRMFELAGECGLN